LKKYILKKGNIIGKKGLPNGKVDAKKEDLELKPEHVKVLEKNLPYLMDVGKVELVESKDKKPVSRKPIEK